MDACVRAGVAGLLFTPSFFALPYKAQMSGQGVSLGCER